MRNLVIFVLTLTLPLTIEAKLQTNMRQVGDSWLSKITSELASSLHIIKDKFSFANCYYDKNYNLYENGTIVRTLTEAERQEAQQYDREVDQWKKGLFTTVGNFSSQVFEMPTATNLTRMSETLIKLPRQPCFCSTC